MEFLAPWTVPLVAGLLTVPPLIFMYFLRLRRREVPVPTTYLWQRAIEDLQVNVPFQRLRRNLLLLLQLLVLAVCIFALARPIRHMAVFKQQRVVLLIDRSASMSAREGRSDRLERAKQEALALVRGLHRGQRAMVIAFADTAEVVCPFTADKSLLAERIRSIKASHRPTQIREAIQLAKAYATPPVGPDEVLRATMPTLEPPARVVICSDGVIPDSEQIDTGRMLVEFVPVGQSDSNIGITAIDARREYANPEQVQLFLRVQNFSPKEAQVTVTVYVNGAMTAAKDLVLAAAPAREPASGETDSTERATQSNTIQVVTFDLVCEDAAIIEARLQTDDALAADNWAGISLPPPRRSSVLLVTPGNVFLEKALAGLPLKRLDQAAPEAFARTAGSAGREQEDYDIVIFDRWAPKQLAEGNYIFFGVAPPIEGAAIGEPTAETYVVDFDLMHPLMRYVSVDQIQVAKWRPLQLPKPFEVLLETDRGPAIAYVSQRRRQILAVGFDLFDSIWPLQTSFPVFMYNAIQYMTASDVQAEKALRPGQAAEIRVPRGLKKLTVVSPEGDYRTVAVEQAERARFAQTEGIGVYRLQPADAGVKPEAFVVNLADANESDIVPRQMLTLAGEAVKTSASLQGANEPLWPYAILAALIVLGVEWYIYNRRVMV